MTDPKKEKLKKIIEEKKRLGQQQGNQGERAIKKIGENHKAYKTHKQGGFFDK